MVRSKGSFYIVVVFVAAVLTSLWAISQLSDKPEAKAYSDFSQTEQIPDDLKMKGSVSHEVPLIPTIPIQKSNTISESSMTNSLLETFASTERDSESKQDFVARDFDFPEKYPGANIEILEEKKIEFMVHELGMFIEDAKKVSETYQAMMDEVNQLILSKGELDEESLRVINKQDDWLLERLGKEDYDKYSFFVRNQMEELQSKQARYIKYIRSKTHAQ